MKRILISICLSLPLVCSCRKAEVDPSFLSSDDIALDVDGERVFTYDPLTCQLTFSEEDKLFRVHSDTMSDYYSIECDRFPENAGDEIVADLTWTTSGSYVRIKRNVTFEVVKLEGDTIWLWSPKDRIQLTVKKLI